jgi:hypothetical protein
MIYLILLSEYVFYNHLGAQNFHTLTMFSVVFPSSPSFLLAKASIATRQLLKFIGFSQIISIRLYFVVSLDFLDFLCGCGLEIVGFGVSSQILFALECVVLRLFCRETEWFYRFPSTSRQFGH